jgi:dCMP deaminase
MDNQLAAQKEEDRVNANNLAGDEIGRSLYLYFDQTLFIDDTSTSLASLQLGQARTGYINWDEFFMGIALLAAQRSKDPCTQVGCVIVGEDNIILSIGYNGMPRGCNDAEMPWSKGSDDPLKNKYMFVVHAEMNA